MQQYNRDHFVITTRKSAKGIKNIIIAVDRQGLANNYDRQMQGQTDFRSTSVMLKYKWETINSVMSL